MTPDHCAHKVKKQNKRMRQTLFKAKIELLQNVIKVPENIRQGTMKIIIIIIIIIIIKRKRQRDNNS